MAIDDHRRWTKYLHERMQRYIDVGGTDTFCKRLLGAKSRKRDSVKNYSRCNSAAYHSSSNLTSICLSIHNSLLLAGRKALFY